jgi:zinc protease
MATSPALDAEPPKDDGKAPGILVLDRPGATQSFVSVAFQGPPRSSPDYEAITLMNAILGGQFTSRLNLNLREKHAYTYGARSSLDWRSRPAPYTSGGAMVRDSTAPALQEIFSEMERMRSELVSAEELENAKRHIVLGLPADFESTADISTAVIKLAVHGLPLDDWTKEASRFEGVTREDVLRVAKTHLPLETARVVIVGDAAAIRKGLETLPRGPVEVRQPASPSPRASATSAPSTKR